MCVCVTLFFPGSTRLHTQERRLGKMSTPLPLSLSVLTNGFRVEVKRFTVEVHLCHDRKETSSSSLDKLSFPGDTKKVPPVGTPFLNFPTNVRRKTPVVPTRSRSHVIEKGLVGSNRSHVTPSLQGQSVKVFRLFRSSSFCLFGIVHRETHSNPYLTPYSLSPLLLDSSSHMPL